MIELFIDLISFVLTMMFMVWLGIFMIKYIGKNSKKHKISKDTLKSINNFEVVFKRICRQIFMICGMLVNMGLAIILAIGSKPIIYRINQPLGEGYALFASYGVAICLYILLPKWFAYGEENDGW